MIIVGLTGGIATGKSVVAEILEEKGAIIIDADKISRDVVQKNTPAWKEIVDTFGESVLQPDGEVDRKALGKIVFPDENKRNQLNHIVHPRVFEEISRHIALIMENEAHTNPVIILDVPLLFETKMHREFSDIILVYAPFETQLARLMARDDAGEKDALARIRAQMPIEEKKQQADYVIDNSGSVEETRRQAEALMADLKQKAGNTFES